MYYRDSKSNPFDMEPEDLSPRFLEFVAKLGAKVEVEGFKQYRGDLKRTLPFRLPSCATTLTRS
jgi:hypothetical protein